MSLSVSGTSGVVNTMLTPPAGTAPAGTPAVPVDFGPAATFTPSVLAGAVELQMYNSTGAAVGVAFTQWLTNGTLPAPGGDSTSG